MMFTPRPKSMNRDHFIKLADQEEVTGVFRGSIHTFRQHWTQTRSVDCTGVECPLCKANPDKYPAFKFRVNFVTSKDGQWISKLFEGSGSLYDQLVNLDKKLGLDKTAVDIARSGVGKNTKYNVIPRTDIPLDAKVMAKINAVPLLPLTVGEMDSGVIAP